jgi:hypothetical protein
MKANDTLNVFFTLFKKAYSFHLTDEKLWGNFLIYCSTVVGSLEGIGGKSHMKKRNVYTDKKENILFIIYKEILNEAVAKSYMMNGCFLIYEEMRKYLTIFEEAVSHIWFCNCSI